MSKITCADWLEQQFSEVAPLEFYRDLFAPGELDTRGSFSKGMYTGVCVQIEGKKARRYSITDELDNLEELLSSDVFTIISPLSYAGKSQKSEMARECYAIAIDLDNIKVKYDAPQGLIDLFSQIERANFLPRPTYIAASSDYNVHLYYILDKPLPLFKTQKQSLTAYKTWLTEQVWNYYVTTDYEAVQQEPVGQGMRAVGSIRKDKKGRVRAFLTGEKVSIEYLNQFAFNDNQKIIKDSPRKQYEQAPVVKTWDVSPAFYEWYKRELPKHTKVGKRYFGLMVLGIIGLKCGVPFEKVEEDALDFVPVLDAMSKDENNRFDEADALKAITAFNKEHFKTMRRETLVRLSGVPMEPNKRNGRKQALHLKIARTTLEVLNEEQGTCLQGRPSKAKLVREYAANHPGMSNRQIAAALGISRNTVNKHLKGL